MRHLFAFLVLASVVYAGRVVSEDYESLSGVAKLTGEITQVDVIKAIDSSDEVILYEGLPHPMFDFGAFQKEAARGDVIWFHDIPFYSSPITLKNEDKQAIFAFLKAPFPPPDHTGPVMKLCGGFHADFCVMLKTESRFVGVMFCFTCADMLAFTEDAYWYADIQKRSDRDALKAAVFRYAAKRPAKAPNHSPQPTTALAPGRG